MYAMQRKMCSIGADMSTSPLAVNHCALVSLDRAAEGRGEVSTTINLVQMCALQVQGRARGLQVWDNSGYPTRTSILIH